MTWLVVLPVIVFSSVCNFFLGRVMDDKREPEVANCQNDNLTLKTCTDHE